MSNMKKIQWGEFLFIVGLIIFYFMWAYIQPFNVSPDEAMRFQVPKYIYNHWNLPVGDDPEVLSQPWGASMAFTPIGAYLFGGYLMKIVGIFHPTEYSLLMAARMASLIFGVGTAFFSIKIGKKLFRNPWMRWLFICMVTLLPQMAFISSYVNSDSMAIFSASCIVYIWILGVESGWSRKHCVYLGLALSVCLMSYYTAYGFLLCSFLLFVFSFLCYSPKEMTGKERWTLMIRRGLIVLGVVFLLTGWWFIRNAILYNGDILGMKAYDACGEIHAVEELKPSKHWTYNRAGYSLYRMLFTDEWILCTWLTFVGAFGYVKYLLLVSMYRIWKILLLLGASGAVLGAVLSVWKQKRLDKKMHLYLWIFISILFPIGISIYYSYYTDFQPQGRYIMPMVVPLMLLVVKGIERLVDFIPEKWIWIRRGIPAVMTAAVVLIALYSYLKIFRPIYAGALLGIL